MSDYGRGNLLARALEGVTLALDSVRASKVRAALTILGVAIGVMVVIAMAATITGIQNSVSEIVQRAGPKSFYVMRYFRSGIQISDGSDEMSPWRKRPMMSREEAEMIS
ncbi:MAG: ABC transporter permease, partial [Gemmatimonadales bacterium]|nr:ABC transporter permease [Gemmatimonadales bacterium]